MIPSCARQRRQRRYFISVFMGIPVGLAMKDHSAKVQVEVVIPRHPYAAVQLHTLLDQLRTTLSDVGLGDPCDLRGLRYLGLNRSGGVHGDCLR